MVIARADLLVEADRFGMRRPQDLPADVQSALDNRPKFTSEVDLSKKTADWVAADWVAADWVAADLESG